MNKSFCFIIPHRKSTEDREANLDAVIRYWKKLYPECEIIITEQDVKPSIVKDREGIKYVFIPNKGGFSRSLGFNAGAVNTDKDIIICIDNDVVFNKETIDLAIQKISNNEANIITPYQVFWDSNEEETEIFRKTLNIGFLRDLKRRYAEGNINQYGGCVIADRKKYIDVGGFNEYFRSFGGEDDEIICRIKKFSNIKFEKLQNHKLYHLYHTKTIDCTPQASNYPNNVNILHKVEKMTSEEIMLYCEELKKDFGNKDKFLGEF